MISEYSCNKLLKFLVASDAHVYATGVRFCPGMNFIDTSSTFPFTSSWDNSSSIHSESGNEWTCFQEPNCTCLTILTSSMFCIHIRIKLIRLVNRLSGSRNNVLKFWQQSSYKLLCSCPCSSNGPINVPVEFCSKNHSTHQTNRWEVWVLMLVIVPKNASKMTTLKQRSLPFSLPCFKFTFFLSTD